jgi:hypothetical protein
MGKRLDRTAWMVLMLLVATAAYIIFRIEFGTGLCAAEKSALLRALTFQNEELEQQLRSTRYFAGIPNTGNVPVDVNQSMELWRRACADRSFDEVKHLLGDHYHQLVPASYYDRASIAVKARGRL